jgi:hypothetical protein
MRPHPPASPGVADLTFAGVGPGDVGELAFERCRRRPAVDPFHFGGSERGCRQISPSVGQ